MKRTYQAGSVHVVIIAVLVLALIGALGWIFYQNFMSHTSVPNNTHKTASHMEQEDTLLKDFVIDEEGISFKHPASWTAEKTTLHYPREGSQAWIDNGSKPTYTTYGAEVTSPSGELVVRLESGISGLGGTCAPDAMGTRDVLVAEELPVKNYDKELNTDYQTKQLFAVQVVAKRDGKYIPAAYITTTKSLAQVGQADGCDTMFGKYVISKNKIDAVNIVGSMSFEIDNSSDSDADKAYDSFEKAKAALNTAESKEAFKILTSMRYR